MTMAQYRLDSLKEGRAEGRQDRDVELILSFWKKGKTVEEICALLDLDRDFVGSVIDAAK